jgi:phosphomannomutase
MRRTNLDIIRFGTDGWRAKIADTYTFTNVRRAAFGLGQVLTGKKKKALVFVGYDTRFQSRAFAQAAAQTLSSLGHEVFLSNRFLPTPALSLALKDMGADAGVMITASHNSGAYNGFKIKLPPGMSAPSSFTQEVEKLIPETDPGVPENASFGEKDWLDHYLKTLKKKVDLALIRRTGLKVVVDSMHGTGESHFEKLISGGKTKAWTVAANPDPLFGGRQPEPIGPNLEPLSQAIRKRKASVGFATDGDGDRIGMMDEKGHFVDVHKLHAILLYHLWVNRKMRGEVVKTVSGTLMIGRMAQKWGIPLTTTPVGFKHIGEVMLHKDVLLGMEESGGIAVKGHLPERDGLLSGLFLLEALATMKKSVTQTVAFLQKQFGPFYSGRVDLSNVSPQRQQIILQRFREEHPAQVGGHKILRVETLDGVKWEMEKGWMMARASGTEPLLRLYAEAPSPKELQTFLRFAQEEAQKA